MSMFPFTIHTIVAYPMKYCSKHNTGMYTLFYAREFDGKGLEQTVGLVIDQTN